MGGRIAHLLAGSVLIWPISLSASPRYEADSVQEAIAVADAAFDGDDARRSFENATTTTTPIVRHRLSGLECRFWAERAYAFSEHLRFGQTVSPESVGICSTYVEPQRDSRWSIFTTIEAAAQALDGRRYRQFDGEFTPARVSPAYLARRSAFWEFGRRSAVRHLPPLEVAGADGEAIRVHRVTALLGRSRVVYLSALVRGWSVQLHIQGPADQSDELDRLVRDHITDLIQTVSKPAAIGEFVESPDALPVAPSTPPNPALQQILDTFELVCITPAMAGRSFDDAIAQQSGWTRSRTREGLPNIRGDSEQPVWAIEGEETQLFIVRNGIVGGDCGVAASGVNAEVALAFLNSALTEGEQPYFGLGFRRELGEHRQKQEYDGAAWSGGGILVLGKEPGTDQPNLYLGIAPPSD